jgi:pimeloyl-ACP methyl ester carboxylesterase
MSNDAVGPPAGLRPARSGLPMVLLHGIGHSQAWTPIADPLIPHRELLLVDLPGRGDSPLPAGGGPLGVPELTDLVQAFLHRPR